MYTLIWMSWIFEGKHCINNNGHGYYSTQRFFRKMFERGAAIGVPYIWFTGATLSEGCWHYQSVWNVGGSKNLYDVSTWEWGSATTQGKDLRDVSYANFFPVGMGGNFAMGANSVVEEYEHIQAISVGVGTTYSLILNQKEVEKCPQKEAIFSAIRTLEKARAADVFPRWLKNQLADPNRSWRLEQGKQENSWILYEMIRGEKTNPILLKK